jgi:hypothetical protein
MSQKRVGEFSYHRDGYGSTAVVHASESFWVLFSQLLSTTICVLRGCLLFFPSDVFINARSEESTSSNAAQWEEAQGFYGMKTHLRSLVDIAW